MSEDEILASLIHPTIAKEARSIAARLSQDHSFAALWKRLDQAERDRDRMLNALQLVRDEMARGNITAKPRIRSIIFRALSRVQPVRPPLDTENPQ